MYTYIPSGDVHLSWIGQYPTCIYNGKSCKETGRLINHVQITCMYKLRIMGFIICRF